MKTAIQACPWFASASIRLTKLKLSASMYARRKLWADASMIDTVTVYTRKRERQDRAFLSLLVTRGRRATRSDTQTTMLIQVQFRTRGEGVWLTESGAVWLSTSTNFTDVLGTSFAVWLTKSDADGSVRALRMCGCADGSRRAVRNGSRRAMRNWLSRGRRAIL